MTSPLVEEPPTPYAQHLHFSAGLEALVRADPRLAEIIERAGPLPERLGKPGFEGLASVVVGQLVSRQSAEAIWTRLTAATGPLMPESYLAVGRGAGPRLGLTAAKADTLVRVAEAMLVGSLDLEALCFMEMEQALKRLIAIKGIGVWTAEVHLLFHAGHPDIFPAGDLALRAAVQHAFRQETRPEADALRALAGAWAPHRSTAARLFWAYYAAAVRPASGVLP